jgi:dUTP pyrophosphatase
MRDSFTGRGDDVRRQINVYADDRQTLPDQGTNRLGGTLVALPRPHEFCEIARVSTAEFDVSDMKATFIRFEPLHPGVEAPRRATQGSAGYDLSAYLRAAAVRVASSSGVVTRAAEEAGGEWRVTLEPGERALIPLGFKAQLPPGYEAQVRPRSGTSFRKGLEIPNAPGTIDADFPDEWMVIVRNATDAAMHIVHGERIAQAVLARYEVLEWTAAGVTATTERVGGFGSTGVR